MEIFVSFAGPRSQRLAQGLTDFLHAVFGSEVSLFFSPNSTMGVIFLDSLSRGLSGADLGIICVTRESLSRPYLLFEAGSLSQSSTGKVIPLIFDDVKETEVPEPLRFLQARTVSRKTMGELVRDIKDAGSIETTITQLDAKVERYWPDLLQMATEVLSESPTANHLALYLPTLKRNPFFSEMHDHLVRTAMEVMPDTPIETHKAPRSGNRFIDNTEHFLRRIGRRTPGAVVIMLPLSVKSYDYIFALDPAPPINLICLDVPLERRHYRAFRESGFFRKLIVLNNGRGANLAAGAVVQETLRIGHTRFNCLICESDIHDRGKRFRKAIETNAQRKGVGVVWLDDASDGPLRSAMAAHDAARHTRRVLGAALTDVALRPTFVFCASDNLALGARIGVADYYLKGQHDIRIVSFDASQPIRDCIDEEDPVVWRSVDQSYDEWARCALNEAMAIIDGCDIAEKKTTITPHLYL